MDLGTLSNHHELHHILHTQAKDEELRPSPPGAAEPPSLHLEQSSSIRLSLEQPSSPQPGATELSHFAGFWSRVGPPGLGAVAAPQPGITGLHTSYLGADELPLSQPGADEFHPDQPGAAELPPFQPGAAEFPSFQLGTAELSPSQPGAAELSPSQTGAAKLPCPSLERASLLQNYRWSAWVWKKSFNSRHSESTRVPQVSVKGNGCSSAPTTYEYSEAYYSVKLLFLRNKNKTSRHVKNKMAETR